MDILITENSKNKENVPHGSNEFDVRVCHFGRCFSPSVVNLVPEDWGVFGTGLSNVNHIHNVRNKSSLQGKKKEKYQNKQNLNRQGILVSRIIESISEKYRSNRQRLSYLS